MPPPYSTNGRPPSASPLSDLATVGLSRSAVRLLSRPTGTVDGGVPAV